MIEKILTTFSEPSKHIASSEIIKQHSVNKRDVREVALADINLEHIKDVLDLGCGFGFMAQYLSKHISQNAHIIGLDACGENSSAFLHTVHRAGRKAEFQECQINNHLPWADNSFDMVVASYSLYFFVDIIPEIARVLKPEGIFVTITHFPDSFSGLYKAARFSEENTPLSRLISRFSSENGREKLIPYFGNIERIDYINTLHFETKDIDNLLEYTRFKLPLMALGPELHKRGTNVYLPDRLKRFIKETLMAEGEVNVKKSDAIFRCREPK
jgi:ubiquinone/menaquinone biosynthesis C-methylase UbiE